MPVIKEGGWDRSGKSLFDLLGYDERALTNAFAYLLARNRHFYFEFMRKLDDEITWGKKNYRKVEIFTEHQRGNGRTDLEILKTDEYHVIVECKIDQNFVSKSQRRRYVEGFQDVERKHLVFLTQKRTAETASSLESIPDDISIRQLTWMEVLNPLFEDKFSDDSGLIEDFKSYFVRSFERMDLIQEILVQDVRDPEEIERYFNHFLYKRDETSGRPLYFCPYFTQKANGEAVEENVSEGINFISRVLGMKTINPEVSNNNPSLDTELQKFESESETNIPLHDKWKAGLQDIENIRTVYFLDQPRKLPKSIIKRETKGSEFGSMNSQISKNYSMGFERLFAYLEEV